MTKKTPVSKTAALAAVVDEIGRLEKELNPLKPKAARLEQLRKMVKGHYDTFPGNSLFQAEGESFVALIGKRADENVVNNAGLIKLIGSHAFLQIARVSLDKVKSEVGEVKAFTVIVRQENTGSRSLQVLEKGELAR